MNNNRHDNNIIKFRLLHTTDTLIMINIKTYRSIYFAETKNVVNAMQESLISCCKSASTSFPGFKLSMESRRLSMISTLSKLGLATSR